MKMGRERWYSIGEEKKKPKPCGAGACGTAGLGSVSFAPGAPPRFVLDVLGFLVGCSREVMSDFWWPGGGREFFWSYYTTTKAVTMMGCPEGWSLFPGVCWGLGARAGWLASSLCPCNVARGWWGFDGGLPGFVGAWNPVPWNFLGNNCCCKRRSNQKRARSTQKRQRQEREKKERMD